MLSPDKKSPLVRLSDAIKVALTTCGDTTRSVLALYQEHRQAFEGLQRLAAAHATEDEIRRAAEQIPDEIALGR